MEQLYSPEWFKKQRVSALASAAIVLPLVMDMVGPKSAVDIGCGMGAWLSYFIDHGVSDVLGLDGDWVVESELCIPAKQAFRKADLTKPFDVEQEGRPIHVPRSRRASAGFVG